MSERQQLQVQLSTGVKLKAELFKPRNEPTKNKLAVCLHPWSWLGGRMNDPVLNLLVTPLLEQSYYVLRYNSRGVGGSTGWASFTGFDEGKDLEALVQWALVNLVKDIESLVLIGYSHGALIASLHPVLPIRTSHILLSYPLGPRGALTAFHTQTYKMKLRELVQDASANVLILFGDVDEFTGEARYDVWAEELAKDARGTARLQIEKVKRGSHFWSGQPAVLMLQMIQEWLK